MAVDFRTLLTQAEKTEDFGRWFKDIDVAGKFLLSVQASDVHTSIPARTLDDVYRYEAFELSLRQQDRLIDLPGYGAWHDFQDRPWIKYFKPGEIGGYCEADEVPAGVVQEIYEDLLAYAAAQPPGEGGCRRPVPPRPSRRDPYGN